METTIKKHSRTSPGEQFKELSLTKQITRPRTERIGKTILKNQIKNFKKLQKINAQIPNVNKKSLARNKNFVSTKTRPRLNYE